MTDTSRSNGRKISEFPAVTTLPDGGFITLVAGSLNEKMSVADFLAQINVTGSFENVGSGLQLYNLNGSVNEIRAIGSSGSVTSKVGGSGNIEIADGDVVTITDATPYTVTNNSENVIFTGSGANSLILNGSAGVGDVTRVYFPSSAGTLNISTADSSTFIFNGQTGGALNAQALFAGSFRKITSSIWMNF